MLICTIYCRKAQTAQQRGFSGIGYHYVIYLDGTIHRGRSIEELGAHCKGYNAHSIGICYVGGLDKNGRFPKDTRTVAQKRAMSYLIRQLQGEYPAIGQNIHGHNEYANKACPCFDVREIL